MPASKFKTLLLLGTTLLMSACGQGEKTAEKVAEKAAETADTLKAKTTKMIEYTTAGQTDADGRRGCQDDA